MKNVIGFFLILQLLVACGVKKSLQYVPDLSQYDTILHDSLKIRNGLKILGESSVYKNKFGLHELISKGNPYQIGQVQSLLLDTFKQQQEKYFFDRIQEFVPDEKKIKTMLGFLRFYNRNLISYITPEYQVELYGGSVNMSPKYDFMAKPFIRSAYMHAAHDIGHAMQDLMMVGCSSFALWGNQSADGKLIIGRNLDFYLSDDFAKEKVVYFVQPEKGHNYMSISWPGFTGICSGMNDQGLTATINAGRSKIPFSAKTPISLLVREIVQYASNIDEAIAIAKSRKVFVSESILIGSANDKRAVIIEVSPKKFGVYEVKDGQPLICTNHFQSDTYKKDKRNKKQISDSHSQYRYERLQQLLDGKVISPEKAVEILRTTTGLNNNDIGYGNEKSLNQLIAHHGIVFQPEDLKVWVSANPYQLGTFVCYDLKTVFASSRKDTAALFCDTIQRSDFLTTNSYKEYELFKQKVKEIDGAIKQQQPLPDFNPETGFIQLNPHLWFAHYKAGKYFYTFGDYEKAKDCFEKALSMEISSVGEREMVEDYLKKSKRKLK